MVISNIEEIYLKNIDKYDFNLFILQNWRKKIKKIKKRYFRKYQERVWLHKTKIFLTKPYLINKNIWYTGKSGIILNNCKYKNCKLTNLNYNNQIKSIFKWFS